MGAIFRGQFSGYCIFKNTFLFLQVQKRYDKVRHRSLRPISETQQKLKQYSTRVDQPPRELVLSRMRKGKIGELSSRGNTARVKIRGTRFDSMTN